MKAPENLEAHMTTVVVVPPSPDPGATAEWVHAFTARLAELGAVPGAAPGATADVIAGAAQAPAPDGTVAPVFSDGVEAKIAQLTKRGKGKANAAIIRALLGRLVGAGLALTPAPETASGPGQPYLRVHRPANGKPDTAGYVQASFFAFTGALAHVTPAAAAKLTTGKSMTWIDLDQPGAVDLVVDACTAFLQNP